MKSWLVGASALLLIALPAHAENANTLTHGMAQLVLHVGTTSQVDVLEAFGGPNITTLDGDGREVWVYDRFATVSSSKDSGFAIGMAIGGGGDGVGGAAGLGFSNKKSNASTSSRSMLLIIKFGADKKVIDFKSRSSSY